jgi:glycosyltransferase involved in cell wall biosynthesis
MQGIERAPNLEYLGAKSHSEVNELLARSHIFVNTSTQEGFPNTFIQAWLRDVAVVSLNADPDGLLVIKRVGIAAQSEAGLIAAVRHLVDNPATLSEYVKRGREHAAAHHSLENTQRLVKLIETYGKRGPQSNRTPGVAR